MTPGTDISEAEIATPEPVEVNDDTMGEAVPTPPTPDPNLSWYLVGSFNDWNPGDPAYRMILFENYYIFKGFVMPEENISEADEGVKFNHGFSWKFNRGGHWTDINSLIALEQIDDHILVPPGTYDVFLSADADHAYFMTPGNLPPDAEFTEIPEVSNWGLVGKINDWTHDIPMFLDKATGYVIAYSVVFPEYGGFKLRQNAIWNEGNGNIGLVSEGTVEAGYVYDVIDYHDSKDIYVHPGTYDIWFDFEGLQLYIMAEGESIAKAQKGTPGEKEPDDNPEDEPEDDPLPPEIDPDGDWFLVGAFNNWFPGDVTYKMTLEGDYYVFKGFIQPAENIFETEEGVKFNYGDWWDVNRGGIWIDINTSTPLEQAGANIIVPAGTYDVYLSADTNYAYFMTPGVHPDEL